MTGKSQFATAGGRLLRAGVPWEFPRAQGLPHHLRCLLWPRCCVHLLPRRPRGLRSPWRLWRCAADQETPEALVQLCWRWLGTWQWFSQAARVITIIYYSHALLPTTISSISSSDISSFPDQSGQIKVMSCLQYASCCANKNISSSSISNIHLATISSSCSCANRYVLSSPYSMLCQNVKYMLHWGNSSIVVSVFLILSLDGLHGKYYACCWVKIRKSRNPAILYFAISLSKKLQIWDKHTSYCKMQF